MSSLFISRTIGLSGALSVTAIPDSLSAFRCNFRISLFNWIKSNDVAESLTVDVWLSKWLISSFGSITVWSLTPASSCTSVSEERIAWSTEAPRSIFSQSSDAGTDILDAAIAAAFDRSSSSSEAWRVSPLKTVWTYACSVPASLSGTSAFSSSSSSSSSSYSSFPFLITQVIKDIFSRTKIIGTIT